MPELIRSAVSRPRMYFKDRRRSPRLSVRLAFSLSVIRQTKLKRINGNDRALKGHTRDISAHGLALLLPQIQLDGYHLAAEDREMQLVLELSGGVVSMVVVPKRYEKLERAELGCNYLIGARIVRIDDEDRSRYQDFMNRALEHGRENDNPALTEN
ncbi:MAG: PilZ domain-containing protein [Pyrinomonadaceae bacterium]